MTFTGWTRNGYWIDGKLFNGRKLIHENSPLKTVRKPHKATRAKEDPKTAVATPEFNEWLNRLMDSASLTNIPVLR